MRLALLALLVAAACGPAATGSTNASPQGTSSPVATATPTATPIPMGAGMGDMMGGGPVTDATVFTLADGEIYAVTLLNHFVRYRIPVAGTAHAVVSPDGGRLFVADRVASETRLRSFDVRSGAELASLSFPLELAEDRALAMASDDRLFVLVKASSSADGRPTPGAGVRVEAFRGSLERSGEIAKAECAERLLASETRIALICAATGEVALHTLVGEQAPFGLGRITVPGAPIVASAMLPDGTVVLGTEEGGVFRIPGDPTQLVALTRLSEGSIVPDGIAAVDDAFVLFTRSSELAWATVYRPADGQPTAQFTLDLRGPRVAALGRYAYFAGERGLWHVDLELGLLERMLTLDDPVPLAVSAR